MRHLTSSQIAIEGEAKLQLNGQIWQIYRHFFLELIAEQETSIIRSKFTNKLLAGKFGLISKCRLIYEPTIFCYNNYAQCDISYSTHTDASDQLISIAHEPLIFASQGHIMYTQLDFTSESSLLCKFEF